MKAWTAAAAGILLAACNGSSSAAPVATNTQAWATQASASAGGGMDRLIAAARAEGQLNIIALPHDWANYGAVVDAFQSKYGIKISAADPNADSQDEIDAVKKLGKTKNAPDVLDLNLKFALANTSLFAPYEVATWNDIPAAQKNAIGLWYEDYGGYMAIGFDSGKLPAITTIEDLLKPDYKGKVALKGDPNLDRSALGAVMMVAVAQGGSLDDIAAGVDFFHQLRLKGNFIATHATATTVKSGKTPVVFDWEYLARGHVADVPGWQVVVPGEVLLGDYFAQAINRDAPHPAAARLWEEFLYSDEGQNIWLRAGDRPVRLQAMQDSGRADGAAAAALPSVLGTPMFLSPDQETAARQYLATHWAKAIA